MAPKVKTPLTSEKQIKVGDYVQFGKYYGDPILWKCADKNNGIMLIAEHVICLKPYDSAESGICGTPILNDRMQQALIVSMLLTKTAILSQVILQ